METQYLVLPVLVTSVHAAPLSVEVQMLPPSTTAASFVPSPEDVMENQFNLVLVTSVHAAPLSAEVQMLPS